MNKLWPILCIIVCSFPIIIALRKLVIFSVLGRWKNGTSAKYRKVVNNSSLIARISLRCFSKQINDKTTYRLYNKHQRYYMVYMIALIVIILLEGAMIYLAPVFAEVICYAIIVADVIIAIFLRIAYFKNGLNAAPQKIHRNK